MEVPGQGRGPGNGQDYELTEHIPERRAAWCVPGQEVTFSGCDVGTSSLINFLGALCQARGVGLKWGQVLLEGAWVEAGTSPAGWC